MHAAADAQPTDQQLLRRFAKENDQRAFATLVQRNIALVYSAAVRRLGRADLAEDVTQAVFIILARKAASVAREPAMSRWLLSAVRYTAANAIQAETRRRRHETAIAERQNPNAASPDPSEIIVWQEAASMVDDAVLSLRSADRDVILLRFFQEQPIAQIAATLQTTEGAIKQRLARALERLRQRLARKDLVAATFSATELARLLQSHLLKPAPPALATSAANAVLHGIQTAQLTSLSKGAIQMMHYTKIKIAASIAAAIILTGADGALTLHHALAADTQPPADAPISPNIDPAIAAQVEDAAPVIVATVPQAGQADVDPNLKEIRVTYSKAMTDHSWSWCQNGGENTFPESTGDIHYEPDRRTCVMPVKLEPGHIYKLYLNRGEFQNFVDIHGTAAVPYVLIFGTHK